VNNSLHPNNNVLRSYKLYHMGPVPTFQENLLPPNSGWLNSVWHPPELNSHMYKNHVDLISLPFSSIRT